MVNFVSPHGALRLVVKPASKSIVDGRIVAHMGKDIQFVDGKYSTDDKKEISFIRKHNRFGVSIFEIEKEDIESIKEKLPTPVKVVTTGEKGKSKK